MSRYAATADDLPPNPAPSPPPNPRRVALHGGGVRAAVAAGRVAAGTGRRPARSSPTRLLNPTKLPQPPLLSKPKAGTEVHRLKYRGPDDGGAAAEGAGQGRAKYEALPNSQLLKASHARGSETKGPQRSPWPAGPAAHLEISSSVTTPWAPWKTWGMKFPPISRLPRFSRCSTAATS